MGNLSSNKSTANYWIKLMMSFMSDSEQTLTYYFNATEVNAQELNKYNISEEQKKWQKYHNVFNEKDVSKGMVSVLEILRDRGILDSYNTEWCGKNNDKKPLHHQLGVKQAL